MTPDELVERLEAALGDARQDRLLGIVRANRKVMRELAQKALQRRTAGASCPPPTVRIGLPYSSKGKLLDAVMDSGGKTMISVGSLRRKSKATGRRYFTRIGDAAWIADASLDSAGFVAMMRGGYDFTVEEYVDFVVRNGSGEDDNLMRPFPWAWWSTMDFCCEQEIAKDRATVDARIDMTIQSYRDTLEYLYWWHSQGDNTPEPMPILQGRTPADYVRCAKGLVQVRKDVDPCTCPGTSVYKDSTCLHEGLHHQTLTSDGLRVAEPSDLPDLVGLGSVCRRNLHGAEGLLPVLDALHKFLQPNVKLHLFGVKGAALPHVIERYPGRIASIDSMAWDTAARSESYHAGVPNTVDVRAGHLKRWAKKQQGRLTLYDRFGDKGAPKPGEKGYKPPPVRAKKSFGGRSPVDLASDVFHAAKDLVEDPTFAQLWFERFENDESALEIADLIGVPSYDRDGEKATDGWRVNFAEGVVEHVLAVRDMSGGPIDIPPRFHDVPDWLAVAVLVDKLDGSRKLRLVHVTKADAKSFIAKHHSEMPGWNRRVMYTIGAMKGDRLVAVATAGHPSGKWKDQKRIVELHRVASDGTVKGAASKLVARIIDLLGTSSRSDAPAMLVTYQLLSEAGTTYKALREKGLRPVAIVRGKKKPTGARSGSSANIEPKIRWEAGEGAGEADWSILVPPPVPSTGIRKIDVTSAHAVWAANAGKGAAMSGGDNDRIGAGTFLESTVLFRVLDQVELAAHRKRFAKAESISRPERARFKGRQVSSGGFSDSWETRFGASFGADPQEIVEWGLGWAKPGSMRRAAQWDTSDRYDGWDDIVRKVPEDASRLQGPLVLVEVDAKGLAFSHTDLAGNLVENDYDVGTRHFAIEAATTSMGVSISPRLDAVSRAWRVLPSGTLEPVDWLRLLRT